MQKHRTKRHRGASRSWHDANYKLPESVQECIVNLFGGTGSQEEPFALEYQRSEYLSKFCLPDSGSALLRRSRAISKWREIERRNRTVNDRLRSLDRGFNILPRVTFYRFLEVAQNLIAEVLGPLNDDLVIGSFSGGASTSRKRSQSLPALKIVGQADVTKEARPFVELIHHLSPLLRQYHTFFDLDERSGAILFTVPKKADIDRCACKEPDINMFLQKGVGKHIRRRLRKFGINLNDQSINRELARKGSIDGSLATLDLSSASDTITRAAVLALLPLDWYEYLNSIRSDQITVDGETFRTEMFSSMGNGFTFELESLIFWALMRTVAYFEGISGIISVYGDDLIIPSGMYEMACWTLSVFGFTVNEDKSFATGPFRESCGGHYHAGVDVTPFYLRRLPERLTDLIRVANQLRRWALADPSRQFELPWVFPLWESLKQLVPEDLWGGADCEVDTQLVSSDPPVNRLTRIPEKVKTDELGEYLTWHLNNWNRTAAPTDVGAPLREESWSTTMTIKCRRRSAKPSAFGLPELFFEEIAR